MLSNRQLFLQYLGQTSEFPLMIEIVRADGVYLYTHDGQRIIDLISGIGVSSLGHNHPQVVKAAKDQLDLHMHVMVYGEIVQSPQVLLAKAIVETLPAPLDNVFFVNSGSEAIEGALKLAKRYTGKPNIVACQNAYHGSSHGALSLSSSEEFKQKFRPLLPGISHMRYNEQSDLEFITTDTAAVVIETVQGEAGVRIADQDYFQYIKERCEEVGALLVLDEIQCGFGRTGTFWAFEQYGVVPDILVTAKAMGGGMPLGAFISSKEIMKSLTHDPILGHISTFGGHPVSAAASLTTLNVLTSSTLIRDVASKSNLIFELLSENKKIRAIRRKGLMVAVEFESFEFLQKVIKKLLENGVLSDWFLFCDNSMRIAPPLVISEEEITLSCEKINAVLKEL